MRALILAYWFAVSIPTALFFGSVCRWAAADEPPAKPFRMLQERRSGKVWRAVGVAALIAACLAGCGGGGSPTDPPAKADATIPAAADPPPPPTAAQSPPPVTLPPAGTPPEALPACPALATTPAYITTCQCPHQNVNGSECVMYSPTFCPVGTVAGPLWCSCPPAYFDSTHDECRTPNIVPVPPPTMSLTASPNPVQIAGGDALLTWTSSGAVACLGAAGWPAVGELAPNGQTITGAIQGTTSYTLVCQGPGGNAVASVTIALNTTPPPPPPGPPPPPPVPFTIAIDAQPPTIIDSSGCPSDYNGTPCKASITVTDSFGNASADVCILDGGTPHAASAPWVVGPYTDDGPVTLNFVCGNQNNITSGSIVLNVVPPVVPQPDVFTVAGSGGIYNFTWSTTSQQGAGGCSVFVASSSGPFTSETALVPGGTPNGSATSGFLSPAYSPWSAELWCSGAVDSGVPSITVYP